MGLPIGPMRSGSGLGRSRRGLRRILAAAMAAAALAGCYDYAPVEPAAVPPGSHVRIRVDPSTRLETGAFQINGNATVRGRLLAGLSPDTLLCSVMIDAPLPGSASRGLRETLSLPMSAVDRVEVRTLDRKRTALLVGGGVALAFVLVDAAFDIRPGREGSDEGDGGIDNAVVMTLLTLRR